MLLHWLWHQQHHWAGLGLAGQSPCTLDIALAHAFTPSRFHAFTGMGYFLLRESMLDSVIVARDRFLAPGGALYPSHAAIYVAPIRSSLANQRTGEFQGSMEGWAEFLQEMKHYYQVGACALHCR
jgi:hypothetical protein